MRLIVEYHNKEPIALPYTHEELKKFDFDREDAETLITGGIVRQGNTLYYLADD